MYADAKLFKWTIIITCSKIVEQNFRLENVSLDNDLIISTVYHER